MKKHLPRLAAFLWLLPLNPPSSPVLFLALWPLCRWRPRQWFNLWLRQRNRHSHLAGIAAAESNAKMASLREARRQKRRTKKKTLLENAMIALQRSWRHCRRRCRVCRHRLQVWLLRRLLVSPLSLLLWEVLPAVRLWFCRCSWRGR